MKMLISIGIVAGYTTLENNITQTMASAGGSIGCIVNIIPALTLMGVDMPWWKIFLWVFFTSFLGVFFAVPLRKQVVVHEKLKFPTGTAAATTIEAMHAEGSDGMRKAIVLIVTGLIGATIKVFQDAFHKIPDMIPATFFSIGKYKSEDLTMGVAISPMLFGAGFLVGLRVTITMMVMGLVTWLVIAPWLVDSGIVATLGYRNIIHWTMWPGIALMVTSGLTATVMRWKVFVNAFKSMRAAKDGENDALTDFKHLEVPMTLWAIGLSVSSLGLIIIMNMIFNIPILLAILSIFIAFFLSIIAVRATGETDINPVSSLGNITQIIFGAIHPGSTTTTLLTAGVTYSGASEAADMMQDLKTGYLVGATPKKQFYAQLIGLTIGALAAVPVYLAITSKYGIATKEMPALGAITASGVAKLVSSGTKLPQYVDISLYISIIIGIIIPVIEKYKPKVAQFLPSAMGLGLAMVLPAFYAVVMFAGAFIQWLLSIKWKEIMEKYSVAIASGGIAGEGITGAVIAVIQVFGGK
jgi:OPT family oligopeptide transporter